MRLTESGMPMLSPRKAEKMGAGCRLSRCPTQHSEQLLARLFSVLTGEQFLQRQDGPGREAVGPRDQTCLGADVEGARGVDPAVGERRRPLQYPVCVLGRGGNWKLGEVADWWVSLQVVSW